MAVEIEITDADGTTRRQLIDGTTDVGRAVDGIQLSDPSVSRAHVRLDPTATGTLVATDLGSTFGTFLDDRRIEGTAVLGHGAVLRLGSSTIRLVGAGQTSSAASATVTAPPQLPAPPAQPPAPAPAPGQPPAPASGQVQPVPGFATLSGDGIEVLYQPGTAGERFARGTLSAARKARKRLAGFGTEAAGTVVRIHLMDPFPDPTEPGRLVTQGSVVDAASGRIWVAVSPEAPPDEPERALATVFAAGLPAAGALSWLVEGYALHKAGVGDVDASLRGRPLPDLSEADDQLRAAMSVSFVRFLIKARDDAALRQVLAEAVPENLDAAFQKGFSAPLRVLGTRWRTGLARGKSGKGSLGQFLKLSWRYLRPHRVRQVEIFLLMLVGLAFTVALPFATRQLFDVVLPSGQMSKVFGLLGVLLAAFGVSLVAGLRRSYVSGFVSGALVRDIRNEMFGRLQYLPTEWYRSTSQGEVLTRLFSDVNLVEDGLSSTLREGVFQLLSIVVTAVILLRLSPLLAVIVMVGTPLVALIYRRMGDGARARSTIVQEQTGALMNVAAESHLAEQVVKVYGLQGRELGRFNAAGQQLFRSERRMALFSGIFGLLVNGVVTILRLTVLAVGSWLVIRDRLTLGTLVAFLGVMGELVGPVTTLTTIGQNLQATSGALERIEEILESPGAGSDAGSPAPPLRRDVRFVSVGFGYGTGPRVLDNVDLTVSRGERVAIVGPSGSGKSTVLRLLMRLHDPDEGSILIDGNEIRQLSTASVRSRLGVVFQDSFLFDGTVAENIALGNQDADQAAIAAAADAAELTEVLAALPGGMGAPVGAGGANLSGGQRQRVAIARALVRNPDILLLDEATSALDPQTERRLIETLDRVSRDRTTIAITHRLASIASYDRILVLDRGRVVETGSHHELIAAGGLYAHLWAEQHGSGPPAAFDLVAALRAISFLAGLPDEVLARVAAHLTPATLEPGQTLPERADAVSLITRGRAVVQAGSLVGQAAVTELGAGDCFGLSALLGDPSGATLVAVDRVELVDLERPLLDELALGFPAVGQALRGAGAAAAAPVAPAGAQRMSRMTLTVTAVPATPLPGLDGDGR